MPGHAVFAVDSLKARTSYLSEQPTKKPGHNGKARPAGQAAVEACFTWTSGSERISRTSYWKQDLAPTLLVKYGCMERYDTAGSRDPFNAGCAVLAELRTVGRPNGSPDSAACIDSYLLTLNRHLDPSSHVGSHNSCKCTQFNSQLSCKPHLGVHLVSQ